MLLQDMKKLKGNLVEIYVLGVLSDLLTCNGCVSVGIHQFLDISGIFYLHLYHPSFTIWI